MYSDVLRSQARKRWRIIVEVIDHWSVYGEHVILQLDAQWSIERYRGNTRYVKNNCSNMCNTKRLYNSRLLLFWGQ